ncbi:MAG: GMC family oxidoreductase [Gammaproteobacteria bacterium]|nr:GMC family oxidoreductase [Gammaproteobacteria bacterium]MDP7297157.1 GMC family oxidoreductase [Gammaproteobacteria bacterium]HJP04123.1 GMC family oxidoreductase [Gammaproteobacteria bacterium]
MIVSDPVALERVEVAIIGSGPGGSVVAATLANAGKSVLLIEEGANLPQDSCQPFSFQEMKQKYRAGGIAAAVGRPNVAYAEASCVGGGSEVNSGLYHRTPDDVLEEWVHEFSVEDLSPASLEPHFAACETVMQPATYSAALPAASRLLREGAEARGMESSDVPRLVVFDDTLDPQGVARSARRSMTESFIPEFLAADGKLLPKTRVHKLRKQGRNWQIQARWQNRNVQIEAENVFICAGAIHSPALLQRSGIRLNAGRSLSMQPMIKLTAEFAEPVNYPGMGIAGEQVRDLNSDCSLGCAISSRAHLAINLVGVDAGPASAIKQQSHLVSYYVMARGCTDGSVRALPGFDDPLVSYRLSGRELDNLGSGLKVLTGVLVAAGASRVYTGLHRQPVVENPGQAEQLPDRLAPGTDSIMTIHLMASCPMGEARNRTAVDSWGKVHGHTGLYLADVSTLCSSPGINPQGTIMALARRNSEHFLRV